MNLAQRLAALRASHPDHVALLRCGDFYEALGDDADFVATACGFTQTTLRDGTPVCGIPRTRISEAIEMLCRDGYAVITEDGAGNLQDFGPIDVSTARSTAPATAQPTPLDLLARAKRALQAVIDVIDTTDPEHESFADSGADSIGFLLELESSLRELRTEIAVEIEHQNPNPSQEQNP